jgi:signal peptidase I
MEWQVRYLAYEARAGSYAPSRDNWGPIVVPEGSYFMLGDNRNAAADSRHWGFVPDELLYAVPWQIYYSRNPWNGAIRLERIGRRYARLSASAARSDQ